MENKTDTYYNRITFFKNKIKKGLDLSLNLKNIGEVFILSDAIIIYQQNEYVFSICLSIFCFYIQFIPGWTYS
ncbi:hypothetical protein F070042J6_12300 [Bacteroides sp. f07]